MTGWITLPETNMETPKGHSEHCSPDKGGLYGFPCQFGGVYFLKNEVLSLATGA